MNTSLTPCPDCKGDGLVDTSGFCDLGTCEACRGSGRAAPSPAADARPALHRFAAGMPSGKQTISMGGNSAPAADALLAAPFDRDAVASIWQGMQYQGGIVTQAQALQFAQQVIAAHLPAASEPASGATTSEGQQ